MGKRHVRLTVVGAVLAVAVIAAGCTNPAPPGGYTVMLRATQLTSVDQNEFAPTGWWDSFPFVASNDVDDEPYLIHLGIRIKLNEPVAIAAAATSVEGQGGYMCDVVQGQTCQAPPGDGVIFGGVYFPDIVDLQNGTQPFELIGSVEIAMEKDTPPGFATGYTQLFEGLAGLVNAAVGPILANGGALPTDPQALVDFLLAVIPPALAAVFGLIGTQLFGAVFGASDQIIGISPMFFFAVGGALSSLLQGILPTLIDLINQILPTLENSPFPNGLPIKLGVLGQVTGLTFGSSFEAPFTVYDVLYQADVI
jgi:hypothetical protein